MALFRMHGNNCSDPLVALSDATSARPTFQAPDVGVNGASMTFEVTVTDAGGLQDTDTCLVNVAWVNTPPVADARCGSAGGCRR